VVYDDTLFAGVLGSLAGDELWQWDPTQARVSAPPPLLLQGQCIHPRQGSKLGSRRVGSLLRPHFGETAEQCGGECIRRCPAQCLRASDAHYRPHCFTPLPPSPPLSLSPLPSTPSSLPPPLSLSPLPSTPSSLPPPLSLSPLPSTPSSLPPPLSLPPLPSTPSSPPVTGYHARYPPSARRQKLSTARRPLLTARRPLLTARGVPCAIRRTRAPHRLRLAPLCLSRHA
jgi:hypothetical protein